MGVEPLRAGAQRTNGRGPQRAIGAPSGGPPGGVAPSPRIFLFSFGFPFRCRHLLPARGVYLRVAQPVAAPTHADCSGAGYSVENGADWSVGVWWISAICSVGSSAGRAVEHRGCGASGRRSRRGGPWTGRGGGRAISEDAGAVRAGGGVPPGGGGEVLLAGERLAEAATAWGSRGHGGRPC